MTLFRIGWPLLRWQTVLYEVWNCLISVMHCKRTYRTGCIFMWSTDIIFTDGVRHVCLNREECRSVDECRYCWSCQCFGIIYRPYRVLNNTSCTIQPTSNKFATGGGYRLYSLLASFHQEQCKTPEEKVESVPDEPVPSWRGEDDFRCGCWGLIVRFLARKHCHGRQPLHQTADIDPKPCWAKTFLFIRDILIHFLEVEKLVFL